ncbi:flavin-dependent oxidoreductase [Pararhodobacter sp. SW119]|uniref:flavin-dependent oxidoreductase n=1 Tax=Pararhodobacter sp. SW119 TaxID=2780075 RepID=UPI001ADFFB1D|nr:flavin-dependent oxidoreductase [Pararhodobacter sp. SW119]
MTVLVAGAGIGGLTLALSLHQAGIPVRVFEQTEQLQPLGVGINVLPHAVRELDEMGLRAALVGLGIETAELAYYTKRGQRIWSEPRGLVAGYRWPQVSVHRGRLQMLLHDAARDRLGPEAIVTGRKVSGFRETADGVTLQLTDRTGAPAGQASGAVLIACDGIHSTIRAHFYPDEGPPIWNGAILWRGVTVAPPFLTGRSMIMAGHEFQKFVCYPIGTEDPAHDGSPRQLINWIAEKKFAPDHDWPREDWNRPGDPADFLPDFESWQFDWLDVPGLIRNARAIYEFPMVDRDPLQDWGAGRVTLLGDAAHPMYPIGSNGASQAILDARVLTARLIKHGLTPDALRAYAAERNPATARIITANRANGPEQVMQLVETRAPDGFEDIDRVITEDERTAHARNYKQIAGFDIDTLNARAPIVPAGAVG